MIKTNEKEMIKINGEYANCYNPPSGVRASEWAWVKAYTMEFFDFCKTMVGVIEVRYIGMDSHAIWSVVRGIREQGISEVVVIDPKGNGWRAVNCDRDHEIQANETFSASGNMIFQHVGRFEMVCE